MVQGKWNVIIKTPVGDRSGVLELQSDGRKLTGFMTDGEQRSEIEDGSVDGQRLKWSAKITKPARMNFKFTATCEGDRITGTARHFLGSASFVATRVAT